ncbi:hypothetical protein C2S53_019101 [Perilla frutescens var. hirtella]|uniref:Membrane insertase YidC/Oxa/ALB C-terminal domain-containing protein n=1 Tax=Perilla frutescens var. hirtella TaxID=608512 RepID=A0AAD4IUF9_PERFH|nr:hypothetical protein C2S53_019101 [Perilla frutescens var. hirtella]
MAFRRSLTARAKFFYQQQQRLAAPLSHVAPHDNDDRLRPRDRGGDCLRRRIPGDNWGSFSGSRSLFGDRRFAIPATYAPVFVRNMSTDVNDVVVEKAVEAVVAPVVNEAVVAPVVNEAVSAASGNFGVDVLQYLIDHVHTFTGLNWWASIAVTTILIRTLILPLTIHQFKALSKFTRIRPQVLEINREETESSMKLLPAPDEYSLVFPGSESGCCGCSRWTMDDNPRPGLNPVDFKLDLKYGINPFTNLASHLTQYTAVFFLFSAIVNMTEKVESFKEGGAFWFTDLTTPDAMYILPLLTAFTSWRAMECNADAGLSHISRSGVLGIFAALTIPLAASAPKAVLCYWITSNLYGIAYGMAMKNPEVQKMLGIPNVTGQQHAYMQLLVLPALSAELHPVVMVFPKSI